MSQTKKITYTAILTAIAVIAITISALLPVSVIPLLLTALCFFVAFEIGILHGFLSIAASITLAFFIAGGLVSTFIFTAFLAAPYSVLAYLIKSLSYSVKKHAVIRIVTTTIFFNIMFAIIVFLFRAFLGEFLFGVSLDTVFDRLGSMLVGYIVLAALGTLLMIFYDITFVLAAAQVKKHLKIDTNQPSSTDDGDDDNNV